MFDSLERAFAEALPPGVSCSLRAERSASEVDSVRRGVAGPPRRTTNVGAMVTVEQDGATGYAATTDMSRSGLRRAISEALDWARASAGRMVPGYPSSTMTAHKGYL